MDPQGPGPFQRKSPAEDGRSPGPPGPGEFFRISWIAYLALAVLGVFWLGYAAEGLPLSLFVDLESWWIDVIWGLGAGGLMLGLWSAGRSRLAGMRDLERILGLILGRLEPAEVWVLALISGFSEELFFRGAMQTSFGLPLTVLIFALLHSGPTPSFRYWTLFAAVAGLLFGLLVIHRGNLLPAIVAHVLVNGVNLRYLSRSPETAPTSPQAP
ncbi:MAG: CPBP family intramembrane glutamic endopeptidase [Acidobacteriota bacterium]